MGICGTVEKTHKPYQHKKNIGAVIKMSSVHFDFPWILMNIPSKVLCDLLQQKVSYMLLVLYKFHAGIQ